MVLTGGLLRARMPVRRLLPQVRGCDELQQCTVAGEGYEEPIEGHEHRLEREASPAAPPRGYGRCQHRARIAQPEIGEADPDKRLLQRARVRRKEIALQCQPADD